MKHNKLGSTASGSDKSRSKGRRQERRVLGETTRVGSDLVLLGALMSLVSSKVGGADMPASGVHVKESIDSQSFGHAMQAMSGKSSEILMLATLAEDLHRSLAGSFKAAQTRFDVPVDPQSIAIAQSKYAVHSGDPLIGESLRSQKEVLLTRSSKPLLNAAPADSGGGESVVPVIAKADKANSTKKRLKNYKETADQMREASDDFLEAMRKLFDEELEDLVARQEDGPEDVKVADGFSPSWLSGLLGLGGIGGGGGGGGVASLVSGGGGGFFGGFGIDGYVANATVFWDKNSNFVFDAGEISTTTDATGY